MRRLFLLTAALVLLTACATVPKSEQNEPTNSGELRSPGTGQISPAKPEQTTKQSQEPTSPAPTSPAPTSPAPTSPAPTSPAPTSPAPTSPSGSDCTYPTVATLQAKASLLKADGDVSFYKYPWGANCRDATPVETWVVKGNIVMVFPSKKQEIRYVGVITLPNNQRGYLIQGRAETPSASAFFLFVLKDGLPRLYHFEGGMYGGGVLYGGEAILSTDYPEMQGDQLRAAQRMGAKTYVTRRYQLNPQTLIATLDEETES